MTRKDMIMGFMGTTNLIYFCYSLVRLFAGVGSYEYPKSVGFAFLSRKME